jgi:leucine dehydrogenase
MTAPWDLPDFDAHEAIHLLHDAPSGLMAIVAIHSSARGPAAGGTRFWHYANAEAAITDALRLSRGMSYKSAMANLPAGGGKAVILSDAKGTKTPAMLDAFAMVIERLNGRYITAQDVGMSEADMVALARTTRHVAGLPGVSGGDPGPSTATGVALGIKAAAKRALGHNDMRGVHVAIQGLGSVGGGIARHLAAQGARLTIADVNSVRAETLAAELGAKAVPADAIMTIEADIFSPCALGAILTFESVAALRVAAVAGGANNQFATGGEGDALKALGILYAPDYVINAGGIINVLRHIDGSGDAEISARVAQIPDRLNMVWDEADANGETPSHAADRMARALIGR